MGKPNNTYRAIISITFDDEDMKVFADEFRCKVSDIDPHDLINGELDNMSFGSHWVEQVFKNGEPTIARLSGGINIEVNEHDEAA